MSFNPGKNVGRVSIRVVPDTSKFRLDAKRKLDRIERSLSMTVQVDRARVSNQKVREDIRRQLAEFKDLDLSANVEVTVDKAKLKRKKLRESIQAQFDQMSDVRVFIKPEVRKDDQERFQHQVRQMVDRAKSTVNIGVNAHTAAAAAQMRYTTRPRWVDVFVRVNKASMTKALTTLTALSGARLTFQWIDDMIQKIGRLDKELPKILNWTSGITALVAAVAGSVSGLVGIGQGLVAITPAFLTLPGLILNAAGSVTVLIVALKNAKKELSVLGDDMNELGEIINGEFWGRARQSIINLVQGLMPQLRNAFRDLAAGVGDFTKAMSVAFGEELADGRLEGIFRGIADGWRILGTGASGFAGALVSLSEIAAKYTPRLAAWFVRQANTFDSWLTAIATDRRLDVWMETAIRNMYALWDATVGLGQVFDAIWDAANTAGSSGLIGFATLMQQWAEVTHSTEFQRGLAAVFRGSYVAMDAFGDAIVSLGRLFSDMPGTMENFIGGVGGFVGRLLEGAFDALNSVSVQVGLNGFTEGLNDALAGILPALQPIADTFGGFLGLLGDLAANLLPTAVGAIAALMPTINALIGPIQDALPGLTTVVDNFVEQVAPSIADLAEALAPTVVGIFDALADALTLATPVMQSLADALTTIAESLTRYGEWSQSQVREASVAAGNEEWFAELQAMLPPMVLRFTTDSEEEENIGRIAGNLRRVFVSELETGGEDGAQAFKDALSRIEVPDTLKAAIESQIGDIWDDVDADADRAGRSGGGSFSLGLTTEIGARFPDIQTKIGEIEGVVQRGAAGARAWMKTPGAQTVAGFRDGATGAYPTVSAWFSGLGGRIRSAVGAAGSWLYSTGQSIISGLVSGVQSMAYSLASTVTSVIDGAMNAGRVFLEINSPSKLAGRLLGEPMGEGIAWGVNRSAGDIEKSIRNVTDPSRMHVATGRTRTPAFATGSTVNNITMPLLPGESPQEQRDNLVRELKWV